MKRRNFLKATKSRLYAEGRYKNPEAKVRLSIKWRLVLGFFVLILTVSSLPFILSYAPAFTIATIEIEGLSSIPKSEIYDTIGSQMENRPYKLFTQKSSFYFDQQMLHEVLIEQHDFKELDIRLDRTHLHVIAEERVVELIWISGTQHTFVDLEGHATRALSDIEIVEIQSRLNGQDFVSDEAGYISIQKYIPVIIDLSITTITEGDSIVDTSFIDSVIALDETLRDRHIEPVKYEIDEQRPTSYKLISSLDVPVLFTSELSIDSQLDYLDTVLKQTERSAELEYIDLRFGNHIFVK